MPFSSHLVSQSFSISLSKERERENKAREETVLHESTVKGAKESQITYSFIVTAIYYPCSGNSHSCLVSFLVGLICYEVSLTGFPGIPYDALVCL